MPKNTKHAEKTALAKARRKMRGRLKAKHKARYARKKGLGLKSKTHPHRTTAGKRY
ncbi:MAG: hypothetical protein V1918_06650 [Planctomycetota bacterium]